MTSKGISTLKTIPSILHPLAKETGPKLLNRKQLYPPTQRWGLWTDSWALILQPLMPLERQFLKPDEHNSTTLGLLE